MSRGAQRSTRALSDQQLGQQDQMISQLNQQGQQDRSLLMPTVNSLLTSPGFSPQQQSDITQQSLGAANTAFDALRERAANRTAATGNSAGYSDLLSQLGREQAQTDASQAQQNQIAFANRQRQDQLAGLNALGQTYGVDTNLLGKATYRDQFTMYRDTSTAASGTIGTLAITPPNTARPGGTPVVNPRTGLISYPAFNGYGGVLFDTLFNPAIKFGGSVEIQSAIPKASGNFYVSSLSHDLESQIPSGRWNSTVTAYGTQGAAALAAAGA